MVRKVIDILPPSQIAKTREDFVLPKKEEINLGTEKKKEEIKKELEEIARPLEERGGSPKRKFSIKGLVLSLMVLSSIVFSVFGYFYLAKAKIEVWPEVKVESYETTLTIDKSLTVWDFSKNMIPGIPSSKEKTVTEKFQSSGRVVKEVTAEGTITVYNNYSQNNQVLVAGTRFVSADGKLFRSASRITVPGGTYEKGKFVPGEAQVKVVADQAGAEYNIGATTFSIPGFAGTEKYTKFYGKSFQKMTGGFRSEVAQVTVEDLDHAEEVVSEKAKVDCEKDLLSNLLSEEISDKYTFFERAIKTEVLENFSLANANDEISEISFQSKAKSETLIFEKKDIMDFAKNFISSNLELGKTFSEESIIIDYDTKSIDLKEGKIVLDLNISAKIFDNIDIFELKNKIKGKTQVEVESFLKTQPKILKTKVEFWPFWVSEVPQNPEKTEFKLNL